MNGISIRDDVTLSVDTLGQPSAPLALLVSGAGAPLDFWPEPFCRSLADAGLYVVRYSHRDTGHSTHFDAPYTIEELLHDLFALTDHLSDEPVHLIGHSMGGYLAQMAMCRRPDLVRSATSISAGPTITPEQKAVLGMSEVADGTWERLMKNQPTGDFEQDLPGWLESWRFLNGTRPFDEAAAVRYTRALYEGDPRNAQVAENHIHAMATVPASLVRELRASDCPLLVIHGSDDPLVPVDHGETSAKLAPNGRFERLDGAGHMFFTAATWEEIGNAVIAHMRRAGTRRRQ